MFPSVREFALFALPFPASEGSLAAGGDLRLLLARTNRIVLYTFTFKKSIVLTAAILVH